MGSKRVTVKPKQPNPLFEKWLTEWRDRAKESDSKMQFCFSIALKSLKKYPLPLESGRDCKILSGFGDKLCKMLDDKLVQYRSENGGLVPQPVVTQSPKTKKPAKRKIGSPPKTPGPREYIPQFGSGGFAILVTLYEKSLDPKYPGHLTKSEIITNGQHLSNTSFTKPAPDTRYTAWSLMKTLLEKKLIIKRGNPAKFSLTDEGAALGDKLYIQQKIEEFRKQDEEVVTSSRVDNQKADPIWRQASTSSNQSSTSHECVILAPNSFEIILLVDTAELNGGKGNPDDPVLAELRNLKVAHEVRNLKVGDYVWICRDSSNIELVLPYIIERKRMDDLGHSIKDGRFHEQKFRLKQCGLQNVIYLVESHGRNEHVGLPLTTLYQAITNTLIQDGFNVKFTETLKGTCEYLACLSNLITNLFKTKTLVSCSKEDLPEVSLSDDLTSLMHFREFNKNSAKIRHFKVKDMFIRQLLQIKGLSVDKAQAIVEKYPTPKLLKLTYSESTQAQGEKLLATIQYGTLRKNVGPIMSKIIYQFFCNTNFNF